MWIKKKEIEQLSEFVKGYSSGEELDIRVNKEGSFNILKNDIYALVNTKNEQIKAVETERDSLSDYMADISHQLKTPITSMMIMADLLEEAEPEKQTEFIHNIQVSLNKMEWLVGALLKMAKLDANAINCANCARLRASPRTFTGTPRASMLCCICSLVSPIPPKLLSPLARVFLR